MNSSTHSFIKGARTVRSLFVECLVYDAVQRQPHSNYQSSEVFYLILSIGLFQDIMARGGSLTLI